MADSPFGDGSEVKLVRDIDLVEAQEEDNRLRKRQDNKPDILLDKAQIRVATDILTKAKCPLLIKFSQEGEDPADFIKVMSIYSGDTLPVMRAVVDSETITEGGLGDLISDPSVPKVGFSNKLLHLKVGMRFSHHT